MEESLPLLGSPSRFLMRVMKDEKAKSKGNFGRLVIAVHAVFLESGFVLANGGELLFPDDWHSPSATLSVRYTLPDLISSQAPESNGRAVVLSFSTIPFNVSINGSLAQPDSRIYRVCFDLSKLAGPLIKSMHGMNEKEEKEVLKLWNTVRYKLSGPLLIEICSKNGLPMPSSLMSLPTDLKTRILDFLPGVNLAKIQCVCVEWRQLASSDQLWKQKYEEEFGNLDSAILKDRGLGDATWKAKYKWCRMRWNLVNPFRGLPPRYQYVDLDTMTPIFGPSRVLHPWPSFNLRRPNYHPMALFRSPCTCPPCGPCTCPPGPVPGALPPGPAPGARPSGSALAAWRHLV